MWEIILEIIKDLPATRYSTKSESNGIPKDVVWGGEVLRKSNGLVHCSGATFWLLVELLRLFEKEGELNKHQIEDLRKWAWCWGGQQGGRGGGLPQGIVEYGLGEFVPTTSLQQGDFVQIWRNDGSGHSFVFAGELDGSWMEWSASSTHETGTGIKRVWGQDQLYEVFAARLHDSFWR